MNANMYYEDAIYKYKGHTLYWKTLEELLERSKPVRKNN